MIRHRSVFPNLVVAPAAVPDPKTMAEQAGQYDVGNFARFRADFLAGPDDDREGAGSFRDPLDAMFDLILCRQRVENARWNVA